LAACHSLTFTQDKKMIRATISPVTLATVGSGSEAYSLEFAVGGFPVVVDIVLFHTTKYLGEVIYSDSVSPQATTVRVFAREAAEKAEGKTVTASTVSIVSAPVRIAHTSTGTVGYRVIGSGPPLVLIMGYGGTMEAWDPRFVDALSQHHRVVIFDNAGVGETHALPTPLTIDAMANQTSALIDTLELKKPDVLGWSMGGMIAQTLAVEHPSQVGQLILCATFPGTGTVRPSQAAINDLKSTNSTKVMSVLFPSNQSAAKEAFEIATGDYPPSSSAPSTAVTAQTNAVDEWFDGRDYAGRKTADINVPTLVADGTVDLLDPVANDHLLTLLIPKAQLVLYPDAGHAFLFQEEAALVPTIDAFLSAH
jgi:pimeloyl-ACP methyl ester carboxylesterase